MILKNSIWIQPLTKELIPAMDAASMEDAHGRLVHQTHVAMKNGEIVGAIGVLSAPTLTLWAHSKKCTSRDSLQLANLAENLCVLSGARGLIVPVSTKSPFYALMPTIGYAPLGTMSHWWKPDLLNPPQPKEDHE